MRPNALVQYTNTDGKLTGPGLELIDRLAREVETLRAEVDQLKVESLDYEARITVLEP